MIRQPEFTVEPWVIHETELHLERLAQTESVFALSNGHIGLRGNLDEGEPAGLPGSYLAGFYETRPLPYAEAGYGFPESGETVVNVTNAKIMRLLVEDEPFDLRYGELRRHERVLDLRAGVLKRTVEWVSPTGVGVRIASTRLVSFTQRAVAAVLYEVEPLDRQISVVVQSELVANEEMPSSESDPRAGSQVAMALHSEFFGSTGSEIVLVHSTAASGLSVAAGIDHTIHAPPNATTETVSYEDLGRYTIAAEAEPGKPLRVVKFMAYGWSASRSTPALRDQVAAALTEAKRGGWENLVAEQREYLDAFWERADVELDGDVELQQAVRFALFHTLQAGARGERRAIAAKGLTGPGYDGHAFWDTEAFVLPLLTYTAPEAVRDALAWRHSTLDLARERAQQLGLEGAAFPWRTIQGRECSGYWPAGTAAFHLAAAVGDAVARYQAASKDEQFASTIGLELLVETARLWRSLGHHDRDGQFRIDGVTGPDEYSSIADNNVYTNLMAERNLREACEAARSHPQEASALGVDPEEVATWADAASAMFIPYDETRGIHPQSETFLHHEVFDFAATKADQYPLLLHFPYFQLYRQQVIKQADLVLALHLRGDAFTAEQKARNFDYYETLTVRDSSLSACTQAVVAAEVGHVKLAYDYFAEAALIDLHDLQHNARDGLHIASLAGTWIAAVAGFGGMRDHNGVLSFAPRLPEQLSRLKFRLCFRGRRLQVDVESTQATYSLKQGGALEFVHHGDTVRVDPDKPLTLPVPPPPKREPPRQPAGRAPESRRIFPPDATSARSHG